MLTKDKTKRDFPHGYKEPAQLYSYTVYQKGVITYVPHYTQVCYVGPGGIEYSMKELLNAGAKPSKMMLWKRKEFRHD